MQKVANMKFLLPSLVISGRPKLNFIDKNYYYKIVVGNNIIFDPII